ncbi:hypothetical protein ACFL6T_00685 [Candidatus Zixiibacteriota bacterium]
MDVSILFAFPGLIFALLSFWTGALIAKDLRARGYPAKPMLIRFMIFRYLAEYRRVTLQETGQVGPLYQQCVVLCTITAFLGICAILAELIM